MAPCQDSTISIEMAGADLNIAWDWGREGGGLVVGYASPGTLEFRRRHCAIESKAAASLGGAAGKRDALTSISISEGSKRRAGFSIAQGGGGTHSLNKSRLGINWIGPKLN